MPGPGHKIWWIKMVVPLGAWNLVAEADIHQ